MSLSPKKATFTSMKKKIMQLTAISIPVAGCSQCRQFPHPSIGRDRTGSPASYISADGCHYSMATGFGKFFLCSNLYGWRKAGIRPFDKGAVAKMKQLGPDDRFCGPGHCGEIVTDRNRDRYMIFPVHAGGDCPACLLRKGCTTESSRSGDDSETACDFPACRLRKGCTGRPADMQIVHRKNRAGHIPSTAR